jgi:lipopolysaccharide transport system ATP-binding protein
MPTPIITVENVSKRYLIGHRSERGHYKYLALRDIVAHELRNAAGKAIDLLRGRQIVHGDWVEDFWALKDVSFEVNKGDVIGVVGHNGAGKSTLLKVLSRITEPTTGRITLRGRVASLLEVGTGFHPELSGRENIYLNGAILGMSRYEIKRRFDEIVAFSEIENFLETPVKRYSSGMYVRLAFAVAAHLESEILIIDEVLAVGDAQFQKKCLGKMSEVASGGRTVLFVSHNAAAVRHLCNTAIVLEGGRVKFSGGQNEALDLYNAGFGHTTSASTFTLRHQSADLTLEFVKISPSSIKFGQRVVIVTRWRAFKRMEVGIECFLRDQNLHPVASYSTGILSGYELIFEMGEQDVSIELPDLPLAEGTYTLDIAAGKTNIEFYVYADNAASFQVHESDPLGSGFKFTQGNGAIFLNCNVRSGAGRRRLGVRPTLEAMAGSDS